MKKRLLLICIALALFLCLIPCNGFAAPIESVGFVGEEYNELIVNTSFNVYVSPYGQIPDGLKVIQATNYKVYLQGTPTKAGTYNFYCDVYDAQTSKISYTVQYKITIYEYREWNAYMIWVKQVPNKTHYTQGEYLNTYGMIVYAAFKDQEGNIKEGDITNEAYTDPYDYQLNTAGLVGVKIYCDLPTSDGITCFSETIYVQVDAALDPPKIADNYIPHAKVGEMYDITFYNSGGKGEFAEYYNPGGKNELSKTGLKLKSTGRLYGTPTEAGSYTFTIMCSNDAGDDYKTFTLVVDEEIKAVDYGVTVGGIPVTSDNCTDVLGNGTVSYDDSTRTLSLNRASITKTAADSDFGRYGIYCSSGDLWIQLNSRNEIKLAETDLLLAGIYVKDGKLVLTGNGELEIELGEKTSGFADPDCRGIFSRYDVVIDGPKVEISEAENDIGIFIGVESSDGNIQFKQGTLDIDAKNGYSAIYLAGTVKNPTGEMTMMENGNEYENIVTALSGGEHGTAGAKRVILTTEPAPSAPAPTPEPAPAPEPDTPGEDPATTEPASDKPGEAESDTDPEPDPNGGKKGSKKKDGKKSASTDVEEDDAVPPKSSGISPWMIAAIAAVVLLTGAVIALAVVISKNGKKTKHNPKH